MADEHVLRIEFQGDDDSGGSGQGGSNTRDAKYPPGESPSERAYKEAQDRADQQRRFNEERSQAESRERADRESESRTGPDNLSEGGRKVYEEAAADSDEPLSSDRWRTHPEVEEVPSEAPTFSASRAIALYDPATAAAGVLGSGGTGASTAYGAGPTATGGAAVAAGGGGAGAGGGAAAAAGAGAGGLAAALGTIAPVAITVVAGLTAVGAASIVAAEGLNAMANTLLAEFEEVNGRLAEARAEQEVALITERQRVAPEGGGEIIEAQTELYKVGIDIRAHLVEALGPAVIRLTQIATLCLRVLDFFLQIFTSIEYYLILIYDTALTLAEHVPLIGRLATSFRKDADMLLASLSEKDEKKGSFQKEAEDFLSGKIDTHLRHGKNGRPARQYHRTRKEPRP